MHGTHRVFNVLQGGREGVDELVGQLGQEADGVHVEDGHTTGQLAGMDGDIQGGEKLVPRLETTVTCQCFDQSRLSWALGGEQIIKHKHSIQTKC